MSSNFNNDPISSPKIFAVDMATTWRSPRNDQLFQRSRSDSSRDRSPQSPAFPISPSNLPQWIRQAGRRRPAGRLLTKGRLKMLGVGAFCVVLGWFVTSSLRPPVDDVWSEVDGRQSGDVYDVASAGILGEPSGFGKEAEAYGAGKVRKPDGIIDEEEEERSLNGDDEEEMDDDEPSVKGALADLHHAVSDKLHSWNPYFTGNKPAHRPNRTKTFDPLATDASTPLLDGESVHEGIPESERLGARVRIGKCTVLFNGNSYWERAIRTHESHDRIHGYRLHILRQQLLDDVWSKPAYILSILLRELSKPPADRLDWLLWVDSDTVILNPYIPIETFLPPSGGDFETINLIYSNDWNGLNNGVFPLRVSEWSANLFADIVAYRHFHPDDPLIFRDQSAMDTLLKEPRYKDNVIQAPQRWFNAYQGEHNETLAPFQIRRGDLLVHFAGVPEREARLGYWLDRAEQHLEDWEVPVKSTSYPAEVRDFWNEQRGLREERKGLVVAARLKATEELERVEKVLAEFGERVDEGRRQVVSERMEALRGVLGDERRSSDVATVEAAVVEVVEAAAPLVEVQRAAFKTLLKAAQEAVFAAEKLLLEVGYPEKKSTPEMVGLAEQVQAFKALLVLPEESWERKGLQEGLDGLTAARGRLEEYLGGEDGKTREVLDREKMLMEAKGKGVDQEQASSTTAGALEATNSAAGRLLAVGEVAEVEEEDGGVTTSTLTQVEQGGTAVTNVLVVVTPDPVIVWVNAADSIVSGAMAEETLSAEIVGKGGVEGEVGDAGGEMSEGGSGVGLLVPAGRHREGKEVDGESVGQADESSDEKDDADKGDAGKVDADRVDTDKVPGENGDAKDSNPEIGGGEEGEADKNDAEKIDVEKNDLDKNDEEKGDTERGHSEKSDTEKNDTEKSEAENPVGVEELKPVGD
ncbi:hypothetical protein MBLNU230_g5556t1 [Neophaeotheca triangularis]